MSFYDIIVVKEMRRTSLCLFLGVFCVANAFAAGATISRTIPTKNTSDNVEQKTENATVKNRSARVTEDKSANISRTVLRKTVNAKPQNTTSVSPNTVSRSVDNRKTANRQTLSDVVNNVGRNARTEAASINSNPALRRAGITLRASTAEVGGRATIGNTGIQTGSNIDEQVRSVQSRASSIFGTTKQKTVTAESLAEAKDILEKTSDLNNTCQQQYNECMDQFCAVVDTNQGRCSCSANLAKYTKVQEAVESANTELNDVAQRIRYVGLSADEISAIMSATEAELEMSKNKDTTETRSMLDDIADMIKDPTSSTVLSGSNAADALLNMEFDFASDSSDMFSLDMFSSSSNDISAKRGTALYNEAKKRCKTVLNRCKDAGGTEEQISGNYDLAIAKDCIAYEQGLDKLNTTLTNNVRSANLMLQKARLAVLQNKNQYDIKGCVGALETCMLDDMVCGDDYVKCLDPTKRYIDENGNVVLGKNIANITAFMTNYNNTNITTDFISGSTSDTTCQNGDGACIVGYLMKKIGTGATVKDGGLCRAVLDKCQDYTYVKTGKASNYVPYNEVVVNYIQRAMVNIKAAQSRIISNYASTCMSDVQECYNNQNTQITSWSTNASVDNIYKVLMGACYNVALTCGYAVFAYDADMGQTMLEIKRKYLTDTGKLTATEATDDSKVYDYSLNTQQQEALSGLQAQDLINGVSELFYQSLLCPDNSTFQSNGEPDTAQGWVNSRCKCNNGYYVTGSSCVSSCPTGYLLYEKSCVLSCPEDTYNYQNSCVSSCPNGTYFSDNSCVTSCPNGMYIFDKLCVESCPKAYSINGDKCVSPFSSLLNN